MRLRVLHDGHAPEERAGLREWEQLAGSVSDVSLALAYRPELFGNPISAWIEDVVRGESPWTVGERELFGAFTAHEHRCPFCTGAHSASAALALGDEPVEAALADPETAPLDEAGREALKLIRQLVQDPAAVEPSDFEPLRAAGVDQAGLEDVVNDCAIFVIMARLAEAFGFEGTPDEYRREAEALEVTGYAFESWAGSDSDPERR